MLQALHHAVADGLEGRGAWLALDPAEQEGPGLAMIRGRQADHWAGFSGGALESQMSASQADAVDFPGEHRPRFSSGGIEREPDAGRTPVDDQEGRPRAGCFHDGRTLAS